MIREKYDAAIGGNPEFVWSGKLGADKRIFGVEILGDGFKKYHEDQFLNDIGSAYFNGRIECLQTLGGKIDYVADNIGSGEGWHRDGNHFQFKAIVYLSDVGVDSGPFQIIEGSHHFQRVISDNVKMGVEPLADRYSDAQIDKMLQKTPENLRTMTATMGAVILVDTSVIHRGCPIATGSRYALTNYYYPSYEMDYRRTQFKSHKLVVKLQDLVK
jgi:hypothetical protein